MTVKLNKRERIRLREIARNCFVSRVFAPKTTDRLLELGFVEFFGSGLLYTRITDAGRDALKEFVS